MDPPQEMVECVEFVESMDAVEFDDERELFRAVYDTDRDSTSLAVVAVVATALDRDPLDLTPLQSIFDTDALEVMVSESSNGTRMWDNVSFCYEGFEVTVSNEGVIKATPLENT